MYCTRCGEQLKEDNLYCPACGHKVEFPKEQEKPVPLAQKKPMPIWFKGLVTFAFLALIAVTVAILFAQNPTKTIEGQLKAIKTDHLSDAYFRYTSKDFQKEISLESFKDFVRENPIFLDYFGFRIGKSHMRNQVGFVKATLFGEKGDGTVVEYQLNKEDGKWKILRISILDDASAYIALSEAEEKKISQTIQQILSDLKEKQVRQAYNMATSPEFQEETSFEDFALFSEENPLFLTQVKSATALKGKMDDKAFGYLLLEDEREVALYEIIFSDEQGNWKIWRFEPAAHFSPLVK